MLVSCLFACLVGLAGSCGSAPSASRLLGDGPTGEHIEFTVDKAEPVVIDRLQPSPRRPALIY